MSRINAALLGEDMSSQLARLDRGELDCRDLLERHLSAVSASRSTHNSCGELPLGLQLVGDIGDDVRLIALAEDFQQAINLQPSLPLACNDWWP